MHFDSHCEFLACGKRWVSRSIFCTRWGVKRSSSGRGERRHYCYRITRLGTAITRIAKIPTCQNQGTPQSVWMFCGDLSQRSHDVLRMERSCTAQKSINKLHGTEFFLRSWHSLSWHATVLPCSQHRSEERRRMKKRTIRLRSRRTT